MTYSKFRSVEKMLRSSTIGPRMVMEPPGSDSTLEYGTHWRRKGGRDIVEALVRKTQCEGRKEGRIGKDV